MTKEEDIKLYSNPDKVYKDAKKLYGKDIEFDISTRKDKKYMIFYNGRWVHFGQMGYEDWTRHRNEQRRQAFRIRNKKWANSPKWSASFLSYHLLW